MRQNSKVTLTRSELMFVLDRHVEGRGKKQNQLVALCVMNAADD